MTNPTVSHTLAKFRRQFAEQLAGRMEAIREHFHKMRPENWQAQQAKAVYPLLHSLTGSAGTFGFHSISDAARHIENQLSAIIKSGEAPSANTWHTLTQALEKLDAIVRTQILNGAPSLPPPPGSTRLTTSPLVHVVEDDPAQAEELRDILQNDGYQVEMFTATEPFRQRFLDDHSERPDAVIMDLAFPEGELVGAKLIHEFKQGDNSTIPMVVLSVHDNLDARLSAFRAGANRYLTKPLEPQRLLDLLDSLTGRQPPQPYRVLLVDDDTLLLEAQAALLRSAGMQVRALSQPLQTLDTLDEFQPDVIVLDVYMPDASGLELAAVLRERDTQLHTPILFLSAETDIDQQLLALNLGGDDFLVKPVQAEHLVTAVLARARRARQNSAVRKRLQNTLYEREREHLALDQHAIVSIADHAGRITYVNARFCQTSGYSREELIGQNHRIIKSGYHPPEFYREMWDKITQGHVWQGEICNRKKDGRLYWVESTITPFLDSDGMPYQYVSIRTDITQTKKGEATLRKLVESTASLTGEDFLRSSVQDLALSLGVRYGFITEEHNRDNELFSTLVFWDQDRFTDNFSYAVAGTPCEEVIQGELAIYPERVSKSFPKDQWLQDKQIESYIGLPLYDAHHRLLGHMGVMDNHAIKHTREAVTLLKIFAQRVAAELQRTRTEQELETNKERLRRGQIHANIGTWDWDIRSGELFWSERIGPLFGYPEGELETSYDNFLAAIHPDDRQQVIDAVNACVEHDQLYEIEHRVIWPDGTVRWLLERGATARDQQGQPLRMLGVVQDIDDRKQAEIALKQRERQLREAQSLARIGNWQADLVSGELCWSDEIYRIFGHQPGSFAPSVNAFHAAVHPDDREKVQASEKQAEKTGHHDVVHRIVLPNGSIRHVHELARAETDANGNLIHLTGTVQDITERIEAESRLRETENRFAFAVEGAGDGVWDWNIISGEMALSGHYEAMLGFDQGEIPADIDTWVASVHPDDLQGVQQNLQDYLEERIPQYYIELRLRCKNGNYKWILCRGTVVARDQQGKPVRMIGIHSDISERKAMQEQMARQQQLLDTLHRTTTSFVLKGDFRQTANELLESLLELTDSQYGFTGEVLYTDEGQPFLKTHAITNIAWDKQAQALYDEFAKKGFEFNNLDTLFGHVLKTRQAVVSNDPANDPRAGGLPPGHPPMSSFMGIPIFYGDQLLGMYGIANRPDGYDEATQTFLRPFDTTYSVLIHSKRMLEKEESQRRELIKAKETAERASQAKSDFLSSMSHELRTPMNAILGFGQLLAYDDNLREEQQEQVQEILRAGNHLLELINEVLDLAKVESGHLELSLEPVELQPLIRECLSLTDTLAARRDIRLTNQVGEGVAVRADRTRLKQALLNLISNAIKYNREAGSVRIDVHCPSAECLQIRVTDTGPGIAPERLPELFQPFNRLDAEHSHIEGTGIGLTLTRRIVELMGGSVDLLSETGVGSTFWIELPIESLSDGAQTALVENLGIDASRSVSAVRHTVIYIEDNPANLKLVSQFLARHAHIHLLTAHTPELGMELVRTRQPQLILLDINMPGMNGYEILEILKTDAELRDIPVVAITANAMPRDIERGKRAGFTDYLTKPLNLARFEQVINRLLQQDAGQ